jgi:hypothetical protein
LSMVMILTTKIIDFCIKWFQEFKLSVCVFFLTLKAPKKYLSSEIYIFYFRLILDFIATFSVFWNHKLV